MVVEAANAIGYIAVYSNGDQHTNTKGVVPLYESWGSAVSALKRGYGRRAYERDELRVIPVFA